MVGLKGDYFFVGLFSWVVGLCCAFSCWIYLLLILVVKVFLFYDLRSVRQALPTFQTGKAFILMHFGVIFLIILARSAENPQPSSIF